jgi:hypothetical protein
MTLAVTQRDHARDGAVATRAEVSPLEYLARLTAMVSAPRYPFG